MSFTARLSSRLLAAMFVAVVGFPASADQNSPSASSAAAAHSAAAARSAAIAAVRASQTQQTSVHAALVSAPSQNVVVTTAAPAASAGGGGGTTTIRNTPDPNAPSVGATAPCLVPLTGALVLAGFGGSLGSAVLDEGCDLRETARLLNGIGQRAAAARLMCNNPLAASALGNDICPSPAAAVLTAAAERACWQDEIIAKRMGAPVCR